MFIEVSERNSGKTTRLVENAFNCLLSGIKGKICIISLKIEYAKDIKNLILNKIKLNNNISKDEYSTYSKKILVDTNMNSKSLMGHYIEKYYLDEFDYIDLDNIEFYENCYLTSSINLSNKSLILNDFFLDKFKSDIITRKYKIEKVLSDDNISFIDFLNTYYKFNIKENIINKIKNKRIEWELDITRVS